MQRFGFSPIEVAGGAVSIDVDFQPASTVNILEQTTSPPPFPQIISDYVGGATSARLPARGGLSASLYARTGLRPPDPSSSPPVSSGES